jgi:hypothetical protein
MDSGLFGEKPTALHRVRAGAGAVVVSFDSLREQRDERSCRKL